MSIGSETHVLLGFMLQQGSLNFFIEQGQEIGAVELVSHSHDYREKIFVYFVSRDDR